MRRARCSPVPLAVVLIGALVPGAAGAQDAAKYYEENCAVCHTIGGGDQAGPDLKGGTDRKDRDWLIRFILDPDDVVKSGDEYALELVANWGGVVMPEIDGLTRETAEALVNYIETESRAGAAEPPTTPLVFTDADRALGLDLFTGRARLANAGPSCLSCHALGGTGGTSGGALGPDLAAVHTQLGGARGVTAWLTRPPTPMMRAIYRRASLTEDESRSLAALFESAASVSVAPASTQRRRLALTGAVGAIAGLAAIGLVWRGRFRSVRRRSRDDGRERNVR
jgi:mono/diheme cytochrome c family protein